LAFLLNYAAAAQILTPSNPSGGRTITGRARHQKRAVRRSPQPADGRGGAGERTQAAR